MFLKNLVVISMLFFFTNCNKQTTVTPPTNETRWKVFNTANSSLPNNQVQAIAIDRQNNKWFGTADGLARLNGSVWTVFTTANSALPSGFITALTSDNAGNVWVGTNKGLAKYDGTNLTVYNAGNSVLVNDVITRLFYDKVKAELWIGTEAGLVKFDGTNWSRFDENNSGLMEGFIRSIAVDKNGVLWVGTFDTFRFFGHIWKFNGTDWSNTRLDEIDLASSFPEGMAVDENNVMWIGLKGTMGAILVKVTNNKWDVFNGTASPVLRGGINSVIVEGNTKWLSSGTGLIAYDGNTWKSLNITNSKIPENTLFTTAIDKDGNKWIGTYSAGVGVYK